MDREMKFIRLQLAFIKLPLSINPFFSPENSVEFCASAGSPCFDNAIISNLYSTDAILADLRRTSRKVGPSFRLERNGSS